VLGEYDGSGNPIQETVWLGDIPVATLRPHTGGGIDLFYVHTDQLNTPRAVTRPSDNVVMWTWYSDPFGTDAANENPAGAGIFKYNLRFAGQLFDGQAGLHANGQRDCYDPATARYCESDPTGLDGGINTYAYVLDPLRFVDPTGLAGEFGGDSITQRVLALIRQGRLDELNDLLEAGGLNPEQEALAKRGLTAARDLIRGGLKRSKSYHAELEDKTYTELCKIASGKGDLAKRAQQMRKLIEQAERLQSKGY
jgi:RHS repeat-associated protein